MRIFALRSACLSLGLAVLAGHAFGQQGFDQPSLLPVPTYNSLSRLPPTTAQVAYRGYNQPAQQSEDTLPSPNDRSVIPRGPAQYPDPPMYSTPSASPAPAQGHGGMSGDFHQAASGGWDGIGSCGEPPCGPVCNNPWYGYGGAIVMGRTGNNWLPLGYEVSTGVDVLTTLSSPQKWAGGYEIIAGKYFNCGCNAIEFRFWQLNPGRSQNDAATDNVPGNFASRLNYSGLNYDDGSGAGPQNASLWGINSQYQCLVHDFNFYSAELDLLGGGCCGSGGCGGCGQSGAPCSQQRWGGNWLAGARYFHFDEYFRYNSEQTGHGTNGEADELWYEIRTKNEMVGFQTGGQLTYQIFRGVTMVGGARFGVYNNHITAWQSVHGGTGTVATFNSGAQAGSQYNITANRDALAFLGEIDLGVRWQVTCHFAARAGYRAVGVSGVATTDGQIARDFSCACDASHINLGSVALHGLYAGGEFCW